jgi:hypothetical protein
MNTKRVGGEMLILLALALGVLGDLLFRHAGWGVNVTVWMVAAFAAVLLMRQRHPYPPLSRWIWVAVALSLLAVFREAFTLKLITTIAMLGAVSYATLSTERAEQLKQTVFTYLGRMLDTLASSISVFSHHMPTIIPEISNKSRIANPTTIRVLRGSALAFIALLLFGSLLVSADAIFERLVVDTFDFNLEKIFSHVGMILLWSWVGCTLLFVLSTGPNPFFSNTRSEPRMIGYAIEINIVLGAINALFIAFISVQAGYFFGGHERVLEEAGLTYAQYARRGFFEIAAVSVLAFALVLVCDGLIPTVASNGRRAFNGLTTLHIGLVNVLIASAFHRLMTYIDAYGLTELRFYVATCIIWIAIAFLMLGAAILSSRRSFLPRIIVVTLFVAVIVLHAINPAAIVVQTNLSRENVRERFDVEYALTMSADAVPALVEGLTNLSDTKRIEIETEMLNRWDLNYEPAYRDWNYSRWTAARVVRQHIRKSASN